MKGLVALWLGCAFLLGASAAQPGGQVTDDRGRTIEFARPPARIVTLLPSLTETICELQACDRLVGVDRFSNWPDRVLGLPKLGGLEDAQLESIVALKPDVVLAASSARVIDRLEEMGMKAVALEAKSLADTRRVLDAVASMLGRPKASAALWQQLNARIVAAAAGVPASVRGRRVYFEVAAAPYAASESSFIGELLARLGMRNAVPAALGPFPKLNPEFVVRAQPDIVMAAQRDLAEMPQRPGWDQLQALQAKRQCGFTADRYDVLVRPGPRLGEAAELLAGCLAALPKAAAR